MHLFADESTFFDLDSHQVKQANIFVRPAHLHQAKGWASMGVMDIEYHKVETIRPYLKPFSFPKKTGDDVRVARMFVRLDNVVSETHVSVYTLLDFFSSLGGLMALLYEVGVILVELIVYDLFIANFMKLFIMVKGIHPRGNKDS